MGDFLDVRKDPPVYMHLRISLPISVLYELPQRGREKSGLDFQSEILFKNLMYRRYNKTELPPFINN